MRYESKNDLPESLKQYLSDELQDIYLEAYQKSWDAYEEYRGGQASQESVAHRDAMHTVEEKYTYSEEKGKWYKKGELPEEETKEKESLVDRIKDVLPGS